MSASVLCYDVENNNRVVSVDLARINGRPDRFLLIENELEEAEYGVAETTTRLEQLRARAAAITDDTDPTGYQRKNMAEGIARSEAVLASCRADVSRHRAALRGVPA